MHVVRAPKKIGPAVAEGYALKFSKRSVDHSGKATLREAAGERSLDVLFKIPENQRCALDDAEGKGYRRRDIAVRRDDEEMARAECYFGTNLGDKLKPYDWYLALVVAGARQHGLDKLDKRYVERLSKVGCSDDPDSERSERQKAVTALECAGFADWKKLLHG